MPLFSIIVPVYNKEKTLARCVDSVLQQTCHDWELLLINDGSTDGSWCVMEKYRDMRIKNFRHDNHGVSYTRNRGLREAEGKYAVFLDADDYWGENFLQSLATSVNTYNVDVYFTGITKIGIDGELEELRFPYEGLVSECVFRDSFYTIQRETQLYGYVPNKVLKRSFLLDNDLFFDEKIKMAEDLDFFLRCYNKCRTFFFIEECGYYYVMYREGTSMFSRHVDYFSLIDIQQKLKSFCNGRMTNNDKRHYGLQIRNLAISAIWEISPVNIFSLPCVVRRINQDLEICKYYSVHENIVWLMCKVFIHQLYVRMIQKVLKICQK